MVGRRRIGDIYAARESGGQLALGIVGAPLVDERAGERRDRAQTAACPARFAAGRDREPGVGLGFAKAPGALVNRGELRVHEREIRARAAPARGVGHPRQQLSAGLQAVEGEQAGEQP